MKSKYYSFITLFFILSICTKCANIVPITGGPQDKKEPQLKKSIPQIGTTNFKGGKIILEFDEEIEVDKNPKNIIVSPLMNKEIKLKVKNKRYLELTIPSTLEENTTYSIGLSNAVKDITEENVVKNISYAFSTGNTLDSMSITGKTYYAENKTIIKNVLIGLYKLSDTLNITKNKPLYIGYSNNEGVFKLNYLKANTYFLLALDDKNKNLLFNNGENIATIDSIKVNKTNPSLIQLELINSDTSGNKILSKKAVQNTQTLTYKNGIKNYSYRTLKTNEEIIITQNKKRTKELYVFPKKYIVDSIQYIIDTNDSLGHFRSDTIILQLNSNRKAKTLSGKIYIETQDLLPGMKTLKFTSNKPITKIKSDSIEINSKFDFSIFNDSIIIRLLDNISDTTKINFKKGSLISYDGDTLEAQSFSVVKADLSNYSILEINIKTESENYLIQLLAEDYTVLEEYKNIKILKYKYIKPGKYRIRAIVDTNKNSYWDRGNVLKNEKPEKIIYYNNDFIILKPNWEIKDLMFIF